jgi:hypothetical protein
MTDFQAAQARVHYDSAGLLLIYGLFCNLSFLQHGKVAAIMCSGGALDEVTLDQ